MQNHRKIIIKLSEGAACVANVCIKFRMQIRLVNLAGRRVVRGAKSAKPRSHETKLIFRLVIIYPLELRWLDIENKEGGEEEREREKGGGKKVKFHCTSDEKTR